MSDFRKPRTDTPIVPQSALFRKVKKAPKKPKGRRGRKPKGKKSGNFVSRQDPNFVLRKTDDEARKAREDRRKKTEQDERLIQLQIEDRTDRRADALRARGLAAGAAVRERQQIQIAQDRLGLDARGQREQLRLQGEANTQTQRYRAAQLAQQANQGAAARAAETARAAEAARARQDSMDIYTQMRQLYRSQERRDGENREVMRELLAGQRRQQQIEPSDFLSPGGTEQSSISGGQSGLRLSIAQAETTDLSSSQLREARSSGGSRSDADDAVLGAVAEVSSSSRGSRSPTPTPVSTSSSSSGESIEEVLPRAASGGSGFTISPTAVFQPRILRGDPPAPDRYGDYSADEDVVAALQGQRRVGGASGSEETQRRGDEAGSSSLLARHPETKRQKAAGERLRELTKQQAVEAASFEASLSPKQQPEPEPASELDLSLDDDYEGVIAPATRAVGRGAAGIGGGVLRGLTGLAAGVGQGVVGQLPTAGETGAFIGRTGYQGLVAAGGLIAGGARGALSPRQPAVGEQTGGTLRPRYQP